MRIIYFLIVLLLANNAIASFENCKLTSYQRSIVEFSYSYGEPYDLGYTLIAIAMRESGLGKWNINLQDPSAGPWHVTLDKGLDKKQWRDTSFNRNRIVQLMVDDIHFSASLAVEALLYWRGEYGDNWQRIVSSYNGGWAGNPKYLVEIVDNIKIVEKCGWTKGLLK